MDSDLVEYLQRIELARPTHGPDEDYLIQLHIGHLTHIPFETFDLIDLKQLNITPDYVFERIVRQRRGGVCYQMNGLFSSMLRKVGYHVQLIPCNVYDIENDAYLHARSHLSLLVTLDNNERFLCDVGFSRDFLTPLFFRMDCVQFASNGFFRLSRTSDGLFYQVERGFLPETDPEPIASMRTRIVDIDPQRIHWIVSYRFPFDFTDKPIAVDYFEDTCPFIVNSPKVILNHCSICRIHTVTPSVGACGIFGRELHTWVINNGVETRQHHPIDQNDASLKQLLNETFNLTIDRSITLVDK